MSLYQCWLRTQIWAWGLKVLIDRSSPRTFWWQHKLADTSLSSLVAASLSGYMPAAATSAKTLEFILLTNLDLTGFFFFYLKYSFPDMMASSEHRCEFLKNAIWTSSVMPLRCFYLSGMLGFSLCVQGVRETERDNILVCRCILNTPMWRPETRLKRYPLQHCLSPLDKISQWSGSSPRNPLVSTTPELNYKHGIPYPAFLHGLGKQTGP